MHHSSLISAWTRQTRGIAVAMLAVISLPASAVDGPTSKDASANVGAILSRISTHDFHPIRDGFTHDRDLNKHGVASLDDQDWRVRTLAVRDLVRLAASASPALIVNKEGVVRFAYCGIFWGDRPSIRQLLEMVRSGNYSFAASKRLKPGSKS